jgi:hypothetical protein
MEERLNNTQEFKNILDTFPKKSINVYNLL